MATTKKLYRSDADKIFAGIIGGIGEYLEIDSTILRVIWLVILVFSGIIPALIVYLLALLIVPKKSTGDSVISSKGKIS